MALAGSSIQNKIDTSIQRLSSGQRINAAKDDVAGMQISMRLNADIKGLEQASKNAANVQSLIDTAESSMKESTSILLRVRELAVQSANGTISEQDRAVSDDEAQALIKEIDRIASQTSWGGTKLLEGTFSNRNMVVGSYAPASNQLSISIEGTSLIDLGIGELKYTKYGTVATSSHPGQNNTNDVTIHGLRPGTDIENYIQLNPDTTNGMNANLSTTTIDNTLETKTKVEILGVEYTLDPGTTEEKNAQLSQYLTADGISNSLGADGNGLQIVLVNSSTLSDYTSAYGSDTFEIHGDPLDNSDGKSNDALRSSDSPSFNTNYSVPILVSGNSSNGNVGSSASTEFQINTYTTSDQIEPAVTSLSDGGFFVTWQSNGQDGDSYGIFGQRYDASGNTVGSEFQVNTTTSNSQEFSTGVGLSDGGFLIAWTSNLQDGAGYGVYAQRYDSNSTKVGNEFRINTYTNDNQDRVSLTQLTNGNVVATWDSEGQDGSGDGVFAQIFDLNNDTPQKLGSEFQVNTYTSGDQNSSPIPAQSVAALSNGDFVVAWDSDGQDGSGKGAFAQIFSSDGTKKGSEFQVNTGTQNNQEHPTVSAFDNGGFIIGFMSYGQDGESSAYTNSYAQRFDNAGNKIGGQFILTDNTSQYQHMPVVTALDNGKFVATWQAQYTLQYKVYNRIFDENNVAAGGDTMVNTSTSGMQAHGDTAALSGGGFVTTWVDYGQQSHGIYGQMFDASGNKVGLVNNSNSSNNSSNTTNYTKPDVSALRTSLTEEIDLSTNSGSVTALNTIDYALDKLSSYRASLGALSSRLDNIMAVNINTSINLSKAKGLITDANYAQETADLAKNNILQQTSIQTDVLSRKAGESLRTLLNGDSFIYKQNFLY